jgi:hypothetical protein
MVNWTAAGAMLLVLILQEPAKDFGTPYTIKVQAKTRWSNSFKKEDFDREFKRFADKLRERARAAVTEDQSGWDEWTFDAAETWKCDLGVFERIFGKHIVIRRYDIEIVGTVKIDAQKTFLITHEASKTVMKLYNRPKLPKDKTDPPDIRSKIDADVKAGHEKFRVSGEVVKSPANSILLDGAEALPKQEKK